jgi:hypothetical protein
MSVERGQGKLCQISRRPFARIFGVFALEAFVSKVLDLLVDFWRIMVNEMNQVSMMCVFDRGTRHLLAKLCRYSLSRSFPIDLRRLSKLFPLDLRPLPILEPRNLRV